MKYHDILGVSEHTSVAEIHNVYNSKMNALQKRQADLSADAYSKKSSELTSAYNDCLAWSQKSFLQKTANRINDEAKKFASPNRVNSGIIGCCTACDSECGCFEDESCCESICGSNWCPMVFDIAGYIAVFSAIVYGIVKISLWGNKTSRHFRYDNAVRENQHLESKKGPALQKVDEARMEKQLLEQRSVEIHAYASFMGAIGCDLTAELLAIEESIISQKSDEIQKQIKKHEDILRRIERNNQIIQRGRY